MSKTKVKAPVKSVRPAAKINHDLYSMINHDLYSILFWMTRSATTRGPAKTTMYFISDELMADAKRLVNEITAAEAVQYEKANKKTKRSSPIKRG